MARWTKSCQANTDYTMNTPEYGGLLLILNMSNPSSTNGYVGVIQGTNAVKISQGETISVSYSQAGKMTFRSTQPGAFGFCYVSTYI